MMANFSFLCAKGYTRPLSVLQIRSKVRNIYSKMSVRKMLTLITPKGKITDTQILSFYVFISKSEQLPDGTIQVQANSSIVPQCILKNIWMWMRQGIDWKDIVERLRPRTVPPGYVYHTWTPGMYRTVCTSLYFCMFVLNIVIL